MKELVEPWSYNLGGLTTLLSIFLFVICLFVHINVSVYKLMIYKWSKVRARYTFWLIMNETQPWKFIGKNHNPIFLDCALLFWFPSSRGVCNRFTEFTTCISFTLFSIACGVLIVFLLDLKGIMHLGKALVVCDLYGLYLHSGHFSV